MLTHMHTQREEFDIIPLKNAGSTLANSAINNEVNLFLGILVSQHLALKSMNGV